MKRIVLAFILLLLLSNIGYSQYVVYEDQAISDVYNWFKNGNYKFQILSKDIPADLKKIIDKYTAAVRKERIWYGKYKETYNNKTPLPYHENFGVSKAEYERMNKEFPLLKMKVATEKNIKVTKEDNRVTFEGEGDFKVLDIIDVDKSTNKVTVDSQLAKYIGQVYQDSSIYGSYSGYQWKFEKGSYADIKKKRSSDYISMEITFAKTIPDGKLLLILDVMKIYKLVTIVDSKVAGFFKEKE